MQLLIEPEPNLLMERTAEIKPFVSEIQAPAVGINFDIGHFYCAGEDPAAAFEELYPWIGHIHIEDIAPSREHNHLIAGLGAIDFPSVFRVMKEAGYPYDMSLERYPYTDRPEATGKGSLCPPTTDVAGGGAAGSRAEPKTNPFPGILKLLASAINDARPITS